MSRLNIIVVMLAVGATLLALTGCGGAYGTIHQDGIVTRMFNEGNLPDDYTYYYTGRQTIPYAIIGLKPGYVQDSRIWVQIDHRTPQFAKMVNHLWESQGEADIFFKPQGAYILSSSGESVGIWYSYYSYAPVQDKGNGRLTIHSPYIPTRWN